MIWEPQKIFSDTKTEKFLCPKFQKNRFCVRQVSFYFVSDTEAGADASAMFYSLLCTAKINNVKTYDAIKYLFEQLPKSNLAEDIEHLADLSRIK